MAVAPFNQFIYFSSLCQTCFFPNLLASAVDAQLVGGGFVFFEWLGFPALTVGDAETIGIEKFDVNYFLVKKYICIAVSKSWNLE